MAYELNETLSPITRSERLKVNENWDRIQTALNSLQFQVNALVGGDLGDLIRDINEALGKLDDLLEEGEELTTEMEAALRSFEDYVNTLDVYIPRMEQGIDDIESLMPVLTNLRDQLTNLNNNVTNQEGVRVTSENGRVSAENGRVSSENNRVIAENGRVSAENIRQNNELNRIETMEEMENLIDNLESFSYSSSQEYNFPNLVLYNGSTYIALQRVTGLTPSNDGVNWRLVAQRGTDGTGSVSSVNGIFPDLDGNVTIDIDIVNNLTSTRTDASLSANQGRILNENKVDVSNKATSSEANAGVNDTKWMTPLKTMEANATLLQQNIASETEANAGTANDKIMTPLRVNDVTGTKANLTTTNKTNLVSAINEVKTNINENSGKIGDLAGLQTIDKSNLVEAINEVFQTGNNVKSDTVDALLSVDSNLPINDNSPWATIISSIGSISSGRKFASGTFTPTSNITTINGLSFSPSYVIVSSPSATVATQSSVSFFSRLKLGSDNNFRGFIIPDMNSTTKMIYNSDSSSTSVWYPYGPGANLHFYIGSNYFKTFAINGRTHSWIAFE